MEPKWFLLLSLVWLFVFSSILICSWFHSLCMFLVLKHKKKWRSLIIIDLWFGSWWLWIIEHMDLGDPERTRRDLAMLRAALK